MKSAPRYSFANFSSHYRARITPLMRRTHERVVCKKPHDVPLQSDPNWTNSLPFSARSRRRGQ